jgi:hypothetical protein
MYIWNLDNDKKYEIKEYKPKRTLSQNSYAWALINELANKMRMSKEEMYINLLEDYSQCLMIPVEKGKKPNGYFKYYKYIATTNINGKEADYYKVFKGSSEFNTEEMGIFLDGIIQECKQLGIETLTPEEIEAMQL